MKKFICGLIIGIIISSLVGVCAVNSIYKNPYKILVNGEEKQIQGYNIDDYSYFKLRDIADAVGGFDVYFNNDTIQLSKDGYVYDNANTQTDSTVILEKFAVENIHSITDPDTGTTYTNVKFLIADITDDGVCDLLAVGIDSQNMLAYIDVYMYNNGNIVNIFSDHCLGYDGAYSLPIRYNDDIFIGTFSYSSSTGFKKSLLKYKNYEWQIIYSSYIKYDYINGGSEEYVVNEQIVSKNEYNSFNNNLEAGILSADDFLIETNSQNATIQFSEDDYVYNDNTNSDLETFIMLSVHAGYEKVSNYDLYNSYASENGLDGKKINIQGYVSEVSLYDNTIYAVLKSYDNPNNVWCVGLSITEYSSYERMKEAFENKYVSFGGTYQGYSNVFQLPVVMFEFATTLDNSYKFEDFIIY